MRKYIQTLSSLLIPVLHSIGEFLTLFFWTAPKVAFFNYLEEKKVSRLFYKNKHFKKIDRALLKAYRKKSPYKISKEFTSLHIYGETPLTLFHQIFQKGGLKKSDCFVDLGCGRGRGVLFATSFWDCQSIGVDQIPFFCKEAEKIADTYKLSCQFHAEHLSDFNLSQGSFFYFYAICMEEEELVFMISRLERIRKGSKVVTVSFPLTDYSDSFSVCTSWKAAFPWGYGSVFLHIKQ